MLLKREIFHPKYSGLNNTKEHVEIDKRNTSTRGSGLALRVRIRVIVNLPVIQCQWHSAILVTNACKISFG